MSRTIPRRLGPPLSATVFASVPAVAFAPFAMTSAPAAGDRLSSVHRHEAVLSLGSVRSGRSEVRPGTYGGNRTTLAEDGELVSVAARIKIDTHEARFAAGGNVSTLHRTSERRSAATRSWNAVPALSIRCPLRYSVSTLPSPDFLNPMAKLFH